jgi:hypothetical protein
LGSLLAAVALAWFTVRPTNAQALVILGLTLFVALLLSARVRLAVVRPAHAVLRGGICIGLQLIAGVSGPVLDLFCLHSGLDRRAIVATKRVVQTVGHAQKVAYFGCSWRSRVPKCRRSSWGPTSCSLKAGLSLAGGDQGGPSEEADPF